MTLWITSAFLGLLIVVSLIITMVASRRTGSTTSFYVAGNDVAPWQNGTAIAGDFLSAAALLGIVGATALTGLSGFYLGIGTATTFLLMALLVAEPLRNLGKFTLADMLVSRFERKSLRAIAALNTFAVSGFYMIAQFVGGGLVLKFLIGIDYDYCIIALGVLMTIYVLVGGMVAITWIQVFKMGLLLFGALLMIILTLGHFNYNPATLLSAVTEHYGPAYSAPPHPPGLAGRLDYISFGLGLALGPVGMPHILIRFLTVRNAQSARRSAAIAIWLISLFLLGVAILGLGAAALVGRDQILAANPAGTLATLLLAATLGGPVLVGFIAAVLFATVVAVMAGVSIAAAGTFSHDLWANVLRPSSTERERLIVAKSAAVAVCIFALVTALGARSLNLAYIGVVGLTIAASANLPTMIFTIYWRRFNETGAFVGMWSGLVVSVLLVLTGPTVMGPAALFPLANVGLVSIPVAFLATAVGTLLGRDRPDAEAVYRDIVVRTNLTA